jgi:transposase
MKNASFDTDLTDAQWSQLEPLLPKPQRTGRPPTAPRLILNALLYLAKAGCQWRLLPACFPPWGTVYGYFRAWSRSGILTGIHNQLRALVREDLGRRSRPTAGILDSQTVRSAGFAEEAGYDGAKKTKGRKRFLLVDTEGHVLGVAVVPASVAEREGAKGLLDEVLAQPTWLQRLYVDAGFSGPEFAGYVAALKPGLEVEVVKRSDTAQGFEVVPRRWVVERTFGWLMQHRRLVRDYERAAESVVAWIHIVMMRIMLRRLA